MARVIDQNCQKMDSKANLPVRPNLIKYHLNPADLHVNPHRYPWLWKRTIHWESLKKTVAGLVCAMVWMKWSNSRHEATIDFYHQYCKAFNLPEDFFTGGVTTSDRHLPGPAQLRGARRNESGEFVGSAHSKERIEGILSFLFFYFHSDQILLLT